MDGEAIRRDEKGSAPLMFVEGTCFNFYFDQCAVDLDCIVLAFALVLRRRYDSLL